MILLKCEKCGHVVRSKYLRDREVDSDSIRAVRHATYESDSVCENALKVMNGDINAAVDLIKNGNAKIRCNKCGHFIKCDSWESMLC
jgi:uncharacterized Zn finger protein